MIKFKMLMMMMMMKINNNNNKKKYNVHYLNYIELQNKKLIKIYNYVNL